MALRNRKNLDAAVRIWQATGRLGDVDDVLVTCARSLADLIDSAAKYDPAMWRQYRQAVADLREAARDDDDDGLTSLLAELDDDGVSADVGNPPSS